MELKINEQGRELKFHGTYGFPVYGDRKKLSSYETGSFPWHWHNELEFTYVFSGKIEYRVNDSSYLLCGGDGLFCNADAMHTGAMHEGGDCDYLSVTVHPRFISGYEGSAIRSKYVDSIVKSPALSSLKLSKEVEWQQAIMENLLSIYKLLLKKPELYELRIQQLFLEAWAELYSHHVDAVEKAPAEDPEKIRRLRTLLTFLHSHYREKITLSDAARQVNLCTSECCRFFKRQMGVSLFDYLLEYRIEQGIELLKAGCTVTEAAEKSGFASPAYFAKVFRGRTGRSPSQYRKESRSN